MERSERTAILTTLTPPPREDGLRKLLVRGLHPLLYARYGPTARRGEPERAADWVSVSQPEPPNPPPDKPGRAPAEKTAPLNQSRLERAPVGTTPIDQFTRLCGARKIYWHNLKGLDKS